MTTDTIANPDEMTSEITNSCQCTHCKACELAFTDTDPYEPCPECKGDLEYAGECLGCWEGMHDDLDYLLKEWKERNGNVEYTAVYGTNMGWLHQAGHTEGFEATAKEVLEHMSIDTEWELLVTLKGKEMTMTRYSHDEYGAHFTLKPLATLEEEE